MEKKGLNFGGSVHCPEMNVISFIFLEPSLGVVDAKKCPLFLLRQVVTFLCHLKSFPRSLLCLAIVDMQKKKSAFFTFSPFSSIYIYTTKIDNILSV